MIVLNKKQRVTKYSENCTISLIPYTAEMVAKVQGDSLARGPKTNLGKVFQNLEKRIQVCLDVKGDQFQHRL